MGRSLAMNSAKSVTTKIAENRISGPVPALVAAEDGETARVDRRQPQEARGRHARGRSGRLVGIAGASTQDLAPLEVDARIDAGVGEVRDEVHHQPDQGEDVDVGEDDGVVARDDGLVGHAAEAIEREDVLDEQRAGEEGADEGGGEAGDDDHHRVAEEVAVEHAALVEPLHARGQHVGLADLVDEGVLGQGRHRGEGARASAR